MSGKADNATSSPAAMLQNSAPATNSQKPFVPRAAIGPIELVRGVSRGGLVPIASGRGHDAAISIRQEGAVLWGGRLQPGETVEVPDGQFVHLFIARGAAEPAGLYRSLRHDLRVRDGAHRGEAAQSRR